MSFVVSHLDESMLSMTSPLAAIPLGQSEAGVLSQALRAVTSLERAYFAREEWAWIAGLLLLAGIALFAWSYRRVSAEPWERAVGIGLKSLALAALLFCLLEPMNIAERARPGENVLAVLADDSKSLRLTDAEASQSRGEKLQSLLDQEATWLERIEQTFDVRRFQFADRVQAMPEFDVSFNGNRTRIATAVDEVAARLAQRPLAGVVLFSDGNSEDLAYLLDRSAELPPIFAVPMGEDGPERDLRIKRLSVSQTNFVASPVTLLTEFDAVGATGEEVVLSLLDPQNEVVESQTATIGGEGTSHLVKFQFQPEEVGVLPYTIILQTKADFEQRPGDISSVASEATVENNRLTAIVDRGGGPYRVLYLSGRPNWEFKYIRRAVFDDPEVELVGLLRIAKREPKFSFRSRAGESTNPLFRGFDQTDEETEQYDQPVLLRINTEDGQELREGFPKAAEELYAYDAIMLDDVDAEYFTPGQLLLLRRFVAERGGGLLMLGGLESFAEGDFANSPVEDLLPVYLDRIDTRQTTGDYRWDLSRDGWLQPWIRLRRTEAAEQQRLAAMPAFRTLNRIRRIKPGAELLATVRPEDDPGSESWPALVTHLFGKGRVGAMLVGDFWRWDLRRPEPGESDLQAAWRQSIRWLCADVPKRVQAEVKRSDETRSDRRAIVTRVLDPLFEPMDNAEVQVSLRDPSGESFSMTAEPSDTTPGEYTVEVASRLAGAYIATVTATAADGTAIGTREVGWTTEPDFEEFRELGVNRAALQELADRTGGELIEPDQLDRFAKQLPERPAPRMQTIRYPLWHQSSLFLIAIGCLLAEWGWRRYRGMP